MVAAAHGEMGDADELQRRLLETSTRHVVAEILLRNLVELVAGRPTPAA